MQFLKHKAPRCEAEIIAELGNKYLPAYQDPQGDKEDKKTVVIECTEDHKALHAVIFQVHKELLAGQA